MFERFFGMHEAYAAPERCFARRPGFGGQGSGSGFWDRFQGGPRGGFGHGFGGGRERLFEGGDVRLVVLKLLSEQPSYGYQLIKTMEQRLAGGYTPSAGVIYPTLTLLEEEGLTSSSTENSKKVYSVTAEGLQFIEANKERLSELFERMDEASRGFQRGRSPEIMRAFVELRSAVVVRLRSGNASPELTKKIAEAIRAAAKAILEL